MVARAKFSPIGDELSPDSAFIQAVYALDVAGMLAQKKEDVGGLTTVAALYIQLGDMLMGASDAEEESHVDHEALERKQGFFGFKPEIVPVEPEQEEELPDERIDTEEGS